MLSLTLPYLSLTAKWQHPSTVHWISGTKIAYNSPQPRFAVADQRTALLMDGLRLVVLARSWTFGGSRQRIIFGEVIWGEEPNENTDYSRRY